jgi:hypothetical protein
MTDYVKRYFLLCIVGYLCFLTACSSKPSSPPISSSNPVVNTSTKYTKNDTALSDACAIYNTLKWAIPLVEKMAGSGKLSPNAKKALADAKLIVDAGCYVNDATLLERANASVQALIYIIWNDASDTSIPSAKERSSLSKG